ncbi:MAG: tRNA (N6-isopentenyl adenosine(37)-C2)-methylthiotransferase MiaB, partial [Butyrivibrio sp.]|nr:tRNA (N6-isopentenyl adenosine(37)-C2)-methylthiotransferase MiaB [Butyrivibrio sp.]
MSVTDLTLPPEREPERQYFYMDRLKEITDSKSREAGRSLTYCIHTFGCQMNARDSEKLAG